MDAVEFFEERNRMCSSFDDGCTGCEINKNLKNNVVCRSYVFTCPQEAVEIVEQWAKDHPRKTRQSEFLKMFPRVSMANNGTIDFCPLSMDEEFVCPEKAKLYRGECACPDCRKKYWLEEVENDGD